MWRFRSRRPPTSPATVVRSRLVGREACRSFWSSTLDYGHARPARGGRAWIRRHARSHPRRCGTRSRPLTPFQTDGDDARAVIEWDREAGVEQRPRRHARLGYGGYVALGGGEARAGRTESDRDLRPDGARHRRADVGQHLRESILSLVVRRDGRRRTTSSSTDDAAGARSTRTGTRTAAAIASFRRCRAARAPSSAAGSITRATTGTGRKCCRSGRSSRASAFRF